MCSLDLSAFLAQAVADAMGADFEFDDPTVGDVEFVLGSGAPLSITDDTQMALFGLEGLTKATIARSLSVQEYGFWVQKAYLDWYTTQTVRSVRIRGPALIHSPLMYRLRAPGLTCLSSLELRRKKMPVANNSNGCGTVMRLLPFGLLALRSPILAQQVAEDCSLYTHCGDEIKSTTLDFFAWGLYGKGPAKSSMKRRITDYGQGWTARSCLEMAWWAFQVSDSYEEMLVNAICHSGDSDSVAAVAGAFWGMAGGEVPKDLWIRLTERNLIMTKVDEFRKEMRCFYGH